MGRLEQPRSVAELMARMRASQDAIALHNKAMAEVAAKAAANNASNAVNGGDSK